MPPGGFQPNRPPGYVGYTPAPQHNLASFGSRLIGYILDAILYGLLASAFIIPAAIFMVSAFEDCDRRTSDGTTSISCTGDQFKAGLFFAGLAIGLAGIVVVAFLYLRALGRTGQTWGRGMAGVKVIGKDSGEPLGIGKAVLRQLVEAVVSGNCILGYLWMLWDKDKQTWHDKIVGSVVIKV